MSHVQPEPASCIAVPSGAIPGQRVKWRAGGGDLSSSILDTLMILQLVKDAAAQALKELVPSASASPAAGPPEATPANPKRRKGKAGPTQPASKPAQPA